MILRSPVGLLLGALLVFTGLGLASATSPTAAQTESDKPTQIEAGKTTQTQLREATQTEAREATQTEAKETATEKKATASGVAKEAQVKAAKETQVAGTTDPIKKPTKTLKQKVAIGRFTNETRYGRSLLRDQDLDPLGKQAADIMAAYLIRTEKFLVFERPDMVKIAREADRSGVTASMIGVDTLLLGSVVEFGRTTDGKRGLFNKKKVQRAQAKVAIRLVDVRTGLVFHSATGAGEATTETKTILGVGSTSKYDATLSDKAIALAIEDMIEDLVNSISARQWRTDILHVDGDRVFISGGKSQGLQVGDRLMVMRAGKTIKSKQSGFDITLPATEIAHLRVIDLFGDNETNEGAVAELLSGQVNGSDLSALFVVANQ